VVALIEPSRETLWSLRHGVGPRHPHEIEAQRLRPLREGRLEGFAF